MTGLLTSLTLQFGYFLYVRCAATAEAAPHDTQQTIVSPSFGFIPSPIPHSPPASSCHHCAAQRHVAPRCGIYLWLDTSGNQGNQSGGGAALTYTWTGYAGGYGAGGAVNGGIGGNGIVIVRYYTSA
jgi:hypothetical protein